MTSWPAVFFFPHQDDEVLTQGAYIQNHLAAGREVICISMSDGQASGVRTILKNQNGIDLSYAAFSKARDREMIDALVRLGVDPNNIYMENLEDGGNYTLGTVKQIMRSYINKFGPGSYKTHSWMDAHRDHHMLGRALDELNQAGVVPNGDARFMRSFRYPDAPTPGGGYAQGSDAAKLQYACEAYGVWAPNRTHVVGNIFSGPRYAIGYKSVGEAHFMEIAADNRTFVHADSTNYKTQTERTAANNWLSSNGHHPYL